MLTLRPSAFSGLGTGTCRDGGGWSHYSGGHCMGQRQRRGLVQSAAPERVLGCAWFAVRRLPSFRRSPWVRWCQAARWMGWHPSPSTPLATVRAAPRCDSRGCARPSQARWPAVVDQPLPPCGFRGWRDGRGVFAC